MSWWHKEPGHQQSWYWLFWTKLIQFLHVKGYSSPHRMVNGCISYCCWHNTFNNTLQEALMCSGTWPLRSPRTRICHLHVCVLYGTIVIWWCWITLAVKTSNNDRHAWNLILESRKLISVEVKSSIVLGKIQSTHEIDDDSVFNTGYMNMMTSANGNVFRVTGPLCREFTGHRWIPRTKASDAELDVFFDLCPNKWLSKQS